MINLKDFSNISWYNWGNVIQTVNDPNYFLMNFDILDKKINYATRQLDYYDLYKFVGSVNSLDSYRIAYAGLANNRALAVTGDFGDYHVGDIILKNDYGEEIHILTKQAGIFVPTNYEYDDINSKLILSYQVFSNLKEVESSSGNIHYDANGNADISLDCLVGEVIYNIKEENSDTLAGKELKVTLVQDIYPNIKFYNFEGEEIYCDSCQKITEDNVDKIKITIPYGTMVVVR